MLYNWVMKADAITYKPPATIGSHITNCKTLLHRNVVTTEFVSAAQPVDFLQTIA